MTEAVLSDWIQGFMPYFDGLLVRTPSATRISALLLGATGEAVYSLCCPSHSTHRFIKHSEVKYSNPLPWKVALANSSCSGSPSAQAEQNWQTNWLGPGGLTRIWQGEGKAYCLLLPFGSNMNGLNQKPWIFLTSKRTHEISMCTFPFWPREDLVTSTRATTSDQRSVCLVFPGDT